jgi:hypothetical protein
MSEAISLLDWAAQEQEPMKSGIVQKFSGESVFARILKFVKVDGLAYEYGEQTTLGGIEFRSIGGSYKPSTGGVNPKSENLVPFGGIVQVDHSMQGSAAHTNALLAKTRAAALFYDYYVINGDPSAKDGAKQFYGLKKRLVGNQVLFAGDNGGALSLDLLDLLLDAVAGPNSAKVLIMSKYQKRQYKKLLRDSATGSTMAEVANGIDTYDGAKIEVLDEDDVETPILPQDEKRGSSNVTGSIYCLRPGQDPEGDFVQGLVKSNMVEHKPLAQVNTQVQDLIEMFGGLGVFHGRAAARLAGLT